MPIPRNWSEELVSEWLQLSGYYTEVDIPLSNAGSRGRPDADVVGAKIINSGNRARTLQIYHIETGELENNYKSDIETLKWKFSRNRTKEITDRVIRRIGPTDKIQYKKLYVRIWGNETNVRKLTSSKELRQEGIEVWTTRELFRNILNTMDDWTPEHNPKSEEATLPEGYWLLKMLEHLREGYLVKIKK